MGGTIAAAARAAIRDPWRILAAAIAVSAVTALLDILADDLVDKTNLPLVLATSLSATGAATFGDVLLSGAADLQRASAASAASGPPPA